MKRYRPLGDRKYICDSIPTFWAGETVVCIATGPSLTAGQVGTVRESWMLGECRTIGINRAYELAPWVDAMYAADRRFWKEYIDAVRQTNIDLLFCTDEAPSRQFGLWHIPGPVEKHGAAGMSPDPSMIHWGGHSGYQAMNLAAHLVGRGGRIVLLGYDCQRTGERNHFHSDYDQSLGFSNAQGVETWAEAYAAAKADLKRMGVEVLNATLETALDCFPRATIRQALT